MNLKVTILSVLFALACAAPCAAQSKEKKKGAPARPDFSGTWVVDLKKSRPSSWKTQVRLVVSHGEPEIKVTRTFVASDGVTRTVDLVYYTDGRGEKNAIVGRDRVSLGGERESETKWKGARLFIRGTEHLQAFGDVTDVNFTESWEMSADGNTLTQTVEYDLTPYTHSVNGDPLPTTARPRRTGGDSVTMLPTDFKRVYNRAP